ncbi:Protein fam72a [Thoreauomyces humboldtii]|nr:Protein fam72a [Thoreauomyces humboldtii]
MSSSSSSYLPRPRAHAARPSSTFTYTSSGSPASNSNGTTNNGRRNGVPRSTRPFPHNRARSPPTTSTINGSVGDQQPFDRMLQQRPSSAPYPQTSEVQAWPESPSNDMTSSQQPPVVVRGVLRDGDSPTVTITTTSTTTTFTHGGPPNSTTRQQQQQQPPPSTVRSLQMLQQQQQQNLQMQRAFQQQQQSGPRASAAGAQVPTAVSHHHPQFRSKMVCTLSCRHCTNVVCARGMKAILLGDLRVELYSTDSPPAKVQLVEHDYMTQNCRCRIRDVAGNVIGYHVTQPCATCLESCNNGHFWMFLADGVTSAARMDLSGTKHLVWAQLPTVELDGIGGMCREGVYEMLCR